MQQTWKTTCQKSNKGTSEKKNYRKLKPKITNIIKYFIFGAMFEMLATSFNPLPFTTFAPACSFSYLVCKTATEVTTLSKSCFELRWTWYETYKYHSWNTLQPHLHFLIPKFQVRIQVAGLSFWLSGLAVNLWRKRSSNEWLSVILCSMPRLRFGRRKKYHPPPPPKKKNTFLFFFKTNPNPKRVFLFFFVFFVENPALQCLIAFVGHGVPVGLQVILPWWHWWQWVLTGSRGKVHD